MCSFDKKIRVVDTLSTGQDLLASHEHIIWVGISWIGRIRHRVEWTHCEWILVQDVEVGVIFFFDEFAEELFDRRAIKSELVKDKISHLYLLRK